MGATNTYGIGVVSGKTRREERIKDGLPIATSFEDRTNRSTKYPL